MEIQLKKIKTMNGHEGIAFSADVYINGKCAAYAVDDGNGGEIDVHPYPNYRDLVDQAEAWAKTLPDKVVPSLSDRDKDKSFTVKMNLTEIIEDRFMDYLQAKEEKANAKKWTTGYAWGAPNAGMYTFLRLGAKQSFDSLLAETNPHKETNRKIIQSRIDVIKKQLKVGEVILNANYLRSLGFTV